MPFLVEKKHFTGNLLHNLLAFLHSMEWCKTFGNPFFKKRDEHGIEYKILLPDEIDRDDEIDRMQVSEAIGIVSSFYKKDPEELLLSLIQDKTATDLLLMKLMPGEVVDSVPVKRLLRLVDSTLGVIASFFSEPAEVGLIDKFRLGHSFSGSYGISLEVPFMLEKTLDSNIFGSLYKEPEERKALIKTFSALSSLNDENENAQFESLLELSGDSVQTCDRLLKLLVSIDQKVVIFDLRPAKELPVIANLIYQNVAVHGSLKAYRILTSVRDTILSRRTMPDEGMVSGQFSGYVNMLKIDKAKGRQGFILSSDNNLSISLYCEKLKKQITINGVGLDDYSLTMDYQKQGKPVTVEGYLDLGKRNLRMQHAKFVWERNGSNSTEWRSKNDPKSIAVEVEIPAHMEEVQVLENDVQLEEIKKESTLVIEAEIPTTSKTIDDDQTGESLP